MKTLAHTTDETPDLTAQLAEFLRSLREGDVPAGHVAATAWAAGWDACRDTLAAQPS